MEKLAMEYAKNRLDLRKVKKDITALVFPDGETHVDIDLSQYRDLYFGSDHYDIFTHWQGWVNALVYSDSDYSDLEYSLAELLDKKKQIIFEAGAIKRKIYCTGIKGLNALEKKQEKFIETGNCGKFSAWPKSA